MIKAVNDRLDILASACDPRLSLFDIKVNELSGETLRLSGRVLDASQVDKLRHFLSDTLTSLTTGLKMDTDAIKILRVPNLPKLSVATNLTGLYEKPTFGMPLSSELYFGTELEVLEEKDGWVFTRQNDGYLGWAHGPYLTKTPISETHRVLAPSVEIRREPNTTSEVLTRVVSGTGVVMEKTKGEWSYIIANQTGWIPSAALRPIKDIPQSVDEKRKLLVEDSRRMIGVPYLWGGTSGNGIDCSGFVRLLHRWVGVGIPRDADLQCAAARPVEEPFQIGDLFFFGEGESERRVTHVGISLGGSTMIHSSRGRNGVYIDDVQKSDLLKKLYMSAGSFLR